MYKLTFETLLSDLHKAYLDARRGKRNKNYEIRYEEALCANLFELCTSLFERTYKPGNNTCFIINDPKKREIFAAEFKDRIVHHLYYNYGKRQLVTQCENCDKGPKCHTWKDY